MPASLSVAVSDNPVLFLFSARVHFHLFGPPLRQKPTLRETERGGEIIKSTVPISETRVSREVIFTLNSRVGLISVL